MVHDNSPVRLDFSEKDGDAESQRDFFKLQLLCDRLNLTPMGVARLVKTMKNDVGNLLGKRGGTVGFDSEFNGREFDLLFTVPDPIARFGKPDR